MDDLILTPEECVDCMKCERNCPQNAIHVINQVPLFCMHCNPSKAPCLLECPQGAIEALGGAIIINEEKCIACGVCESACPIGAINIDGIGNIQKCNLCIDLEEKQCVSSCPTGALKDNPKEQISEKQKRVAKEFNKVKELLK
ncbi:MAG: 4Fe-4S binding protein [Methanobrevibacter sp.]|nr:4Fe-4S binding protein [Methanobrevibacter sp.]